MFKVMFKKTFFSVGVLSAVVLLAVHSRSLQAASATSEQEPLAAPEVAVPVACEGEAIQGKDCARWYELFEKANPEACKVSQAPSENCPPRWYSVLDITVPDTVTIRTSRIHFEFDKADLLPQSHPFLDQIVAVGKLPEVRHISIEGHADAIGSDEYNRELSDRRAGSVKEYLIAHGVSEDKVASVGKGESEPVAENEVDHRDNPKGRDLNRRAEFHIQLAPQVEAKVVQEDQAPTFPDEERKREQVSSR